MSDYTEKERKRLLAILGENRELISLAHGKLYTSAKGSKEWLYSDLDGFLCFVLDKQENARYLILYDTDNYEKLFFFELYKNFNKYYKVLKELYHCFEMNNGFIMIQFTNLESAKKFSETIINPLEDKKLILSFVKNNLNDTITMLKRKFSKEIINKDKNYDESFFKEEGIEISMPRHFEFLNNINYNSEKQQFVLGDIGEDLINIFRQLGVKKKLFKKS